MADAGASLQVAIIGAGPAGLRAAETLIRHGLKPVLIDEAAKLGGQIYRQPPDGAERPGSEIYGFEARKAARLHNLQPMLAASADYRPATLVWNISRNAHSFRLDLMHADSLAALDVDRIILATGAVDRVLPFPGWTTPGVFSLGAAQIALKSQGVAIGQRIALVGAGPLLPLLAAQFLAAGMKPAAVLDVTPFLTKLTALPGLLAKPATLFKGVIYTARAILAGVAIESGVFGLRAVVNQDVTGDVTGDVTARVGALEYTSSNGDTRQIACDAIACSFGLRSETQLADLAGCRFAFNPMTRQWEPAQDGAGRASVPGVYLAGDGVTIGGADVAEWQGERAAYSLLADTGHAHDDQRRHTIDHALARQSRFRAALEAAYPFPAHLVAAIPDTTIVCRCEGVTAGTLRETIGARDPVDVNRLKAFTRLGMGRCQGRLCGHVGAELLAATRGGDIAGAGRLRAQPPVKPLPLALALEPAP